MWTLMRAAQLLLAAAGLCFAAFPAAAELPDGSVLVTSAATVEQHAVPTLISLPGGVFSALDTPEAFALVPYHDSGAILAYSVDEAAAEVIDPTRFAPPTSRARWYDPALSDTLPATVIEATAAGTEARFEVGGMERTLTDLVGTPGSALVFVSVPEPAIASGLIVGMALLAALARARSRERIGADRQNRRRFRYRR